MCTKISFSGSSPPLASFFFLSSFLPLASLGFFSFFSFLGAASAIVAYEILNVVQKDTKLRNNGVKKQLRSIK